ncbi:MAG TPA: YihY/virulence factor BrkB family protein [Myxococcales bacterium]|jgi:YihY family inner membrane protein
MDWPRRLWTFLSRLLRFGGRVVGAFLSNRGILLAGGVGYNVLLSLVPFLTLAVASLSVFFEEERILGIVRSELNMLVPQHADTILQAVQTFLQNQAATRAVSFVFLLLFSGIAFRMLEEAVAAIFQTHTGLASRRFWVSALLPYVFNLVLMSALFLVTLLNSGLDALGHGSVRLLGVELFLASSARLLLRVAGFAGLVVLFAGIYRFLPVVRISLRRAFIGGFCAAVLWRLVAFLMAYYFTNISMVNLIYGSLATVIVVLLFLETAFVILLLGAQVIAELEASAAAGLRWDERPRKA